MYFFSDTSVIHEPLASLQTMLLPVGARLTAGAAWVSRIRRACSVVYVAKPRTFAPLRIVDFLDRLCVAKVQWLTPGERSPWG
jgi:hypothetical protein